MVVMPVRSAMIAGSANCSVELARPSGWIMCHTVCPCDATRSTSAGASPAAWITFSAALANSSPRSAFNSQISSVPVCPGTHAFMMRCAKPGGNGNGVECTIRALMCGGAPSISQTAASMPSMDVPEIMPTIFMELPPLR